MFVLFAQLIAHHLNAEDQLKEAQELLIDERQLSEVSDETETRFSLRMAIDNTGQSDRA